MASLSAMLGDYADDSDSGEDQGSPANSAAGSVAGSIGPLVTYPEEDEDGEDEKQSGDEKKKLDPQSDSLLPSPSPQFRTSHDGTKAKRTDVASMIRSSPRVASPVPRPQPTVSTPTPASPMSESGNEGPPAVASDSEDTDIYPFKHVPVQLPPSPPGHVDPAMAEKVRKLLERSAKTGRKYNQELKRHKQFHNPRTVQQLVKKYNLEELGSNYPKDIFDPDEFGEGSYYEELAAKQTAYLKQRDKARATRTTVEFVKAPPAPGVAAGVAAAAPGGKTSQASSLIAQDPRLAGAQRVMQLAANMGIRASSPAPGAAAVAAAAAATSLGEAGKRKSKWDTDKTTKTAKL
eukprot:comp15380_c0_seq1/m.12300 comp15380_c0_seq1/g.12300  ORF comp15380_c0_seq1/g.12300 comp15380_c0_seq1/m.12300 type:complete len:348 (-) comp15380_c0_seq1:169-1212(-)